MTPMPNPGPDPTRDPAPDPCQVSAMEGKFYRHKTPNHPHTNMAKAALEATTLCTTPATLCIPPATLCTPPATLCIPPAALCTPLQPYLSHLQPYLSHLQPYLSQAALNMMTRTSAAELAASHAIYMTAVDTGWINDENPREKAARTAELHDFQTPLDEVDAAARVLHPVFEGLTTGNPQFGVFFKDYQETEW